MSAQGSANTLVITLATEQYGERSNFQFNAGDLTVLTGPTSSRKSALLRELYAESTVRLKALERLSGRGDRDDFIRIDQPGEIRNLRPVRLIESSVNRSDTIGSFLGFQSWLKPLLAQFGRLACAHCGGEIRRSTPHEIQSEAGRFFAHERASLAVAISVDHAIATETLSTNERRNIQAAGIQKIILDGKIVDLDRIEDGATIGPLQGVLDLIEPAAQDLTERLEFALHLALRSPTLRIGIHRLSLLPSGEWIQTDAHYFSMRGLCTTCGRVTAKELLDNLDLRVGRSLEHQELLNVNSVPLTEILTSPLSNLLNLLQQDGAIKVSLHGSSALRCLRLLEQLGLAHLSLTRSIQTLSRGESTRINLARVLIRPLTHMLYLWDKPCFGLQHEELRKIAAVIRSELLPNNTVLIASNEEGLTEAADQVLPVCSSSPLRSAETTKHRKDASSKNLFTLDIPQNWEPVFRERQITFLLRAITCVIGQSGSGKTRLISEIIPSAFEFLPDRTLKFLRILPAEYSVRPRGTVVGALGLWDSVTEILAELSLSRLRGYSKKMFSLSSAPFTEELLDLRYKGHTIEGMLQLSLREATGLFANLRGWKNTFKVVEQLGCDYLLLGTLLNELHPGETRKLQLVKTLQKLKPGTLLLLDDPIIGFDRNEVDQLLSVLRNTVDQGVTVIASSHDPYFIAEVDHRIELDAITPALPKD